MINRYMQSVNGQEFFKGDAGNSEVYHTTVFMAENCSAFQMDVEDEIVFDDQMTCFNCRYRRWQAEGFTCYKQFPIKCLEEKS
ncbi:hypothetical protein [Neobacillus sp. FSL H8-0543]|uniref:hypothetical protein n=1 Tax=Neobacillus sp. FSL H8-0543 TaxID=2954672 RepID=UPI0031586AB8